MGSGGRSPDEVVLAVDLGTGGPKVGFVSLSGEVIDHEHRRVEMRVLPDGGAVENPDDWWGAVVASAARLAERGAVQPQHIIAVACTGQWGSTVPVDRSGHAAGECLLWLDHRGRELAREQLGGRFTIEGYGPRAAVEWIRRAGGAPSPEGNDPLGHRLWISRMDPTLDADTAVFLEPVDFLNLRLTGRVAATQATMTLSWLTDNRMLDRVEYDPVLVGLAGADADRLPGLVPIRSVVGGVSAEAAAALGIPAGVPVVTGLPDLHSAALGSGAVADHHGHVVIGTSAWVGCHTPRKRTSLAHQMATVPAAIADRYVLANNHDTGGISLEWLRDQVVAPDDGLGRGRPTLADLDAIAAQVPPGAGGVMFAPWLKGERSPVADTAMRASFLNLGIDTGRPEMVRAVLEGVAHQVRWMLDRVREGGSPPPERPPGHRRRGAIRRLVPDPRRRPRSASGPSRPAAPGQPEGCGALRRAGHRATGPGRDRAGGDGGSDVHARPGRGGGARGPPPRVRQDPPVPTTHVPPAEPGGPGVDLPPLI